MINKVNVLLDKCIACNGFIIINCFNKKYYNKCLNCKRKFINEYNSIFIENPEGKIIAIARYDFKDNLFIFHQQINFPQILFKDTLDNFLIKVKKYFDNLIFEE